MNPYDMNPYNLNPYGINKEILEEYQKQYLQINSDLIKASQEEQAKILALAQAEYDTIMTHKAQKEIQKRVNKEKLKNSNPFIDIYELISPITKDTKEVPLESPPISFINTNRQISQPNSVPSSPKNNAEETPGKQLTGLGLGKNSETQTSLVFGRNRKRNSKKKFKKSTKKNRKSIKRKYL